MYRAKHSDENQQNKISLPLMIASVLTQFVYNAIWHTFPQLLFCRQGNNYFIWHGKPLLVLHTLKRVFYKP
jgi:hypothetical protein